MVNSLPPRNSQMCQPVTKDNKCNNHKSECSSVTLKLPKWLYCYLPVLLIILAMVVSAMLSRYSQQRLESLMLSKAETLGVEAVNVFVDLDKDGDLHLSLEEAETLLKHFVDVSHGNPSDFNVDVAPGEEVVTLQASFSPLNPATMTKDFEHDVQNNDTFHGLFHWLSPEVPLKDFGVSRFLDLLPEDMDKLTTGTVYYLVAPQSGPWGSPHLSSNRHFPPRVKGRELTLQHMLAMLHPRPFIRMRFPPQGAIACVRAVSSSHVAVVFRIHAEFQLNEPPHLPFWFTPSQLTGELVMRRDGSTVESFHLGVPTDKRLNVDMEWLNNDGDPESMEVDIGYMDGMEIKALDKKDHGNEARNDNTATSTIEWDDEISMQGAKDALELKLFPFKEIPYHNLSTALSIAQSRHQLVHSILLWGALDDQSC